MPLGLVGGIEGAEAGEGYGTYWVMVRWRDMRHGPSIRSRMCGQMERMLTG